ncbi:MAG: HepT-like ribonuclease domain-containing protein, partial [Ktedonobacteraceae bacterium]
LAGGRRAVSKQRKAYARHILETIQKLERIQKRGNLADDDILYHAALRNLQTLSEATQRLPESIKLRHHTIPWKEISGFRNILVHNYLGDIDPQTVQAVLDRNLPPLRDAIEAILVAHGGEV